MRGGMALGGLRTNARAIPRSSLRAQSSHHGVLAGSREADRSPGVPHNPRP